MSTHNMCFLREIRKIINFWAGKSWLDKWIRTIYANRFFFCISVLRVASGPRVKLASCKSALNPLVVNSTDHSKAVVPVLVLFLLLCDLFYEAICFKSCLVLFCYCGFQSFEHCDYLTWGRDRANLSAFRTFIRFALVWFCLFPLPLGVWEELRLVIVALPGLFSYLFCPWTGNKPCYSTHRFITIYEYDLIAFVVKLWKSLIPWIFVLDMGSSSNWGWITACQARRQMGIIYGCFLNFL